MYQSIKEDARVLHTRTRTDLSFSMNTWDSEGLGVRLRAG
jgi:hypothetical protein